MVDALKTTLAGGTGVDGGGVDALPAAAVAHDPARDHFQAGDVGGTPVPLVADEPGQRYPSLDELLAVVADGLAMLT